MSAADDDESKMVVDSSGGNENEEGEDVEEAEAVRNTFVVASELVFRLGLPAELQEDRKDDEERLRGIVTEGRMVEFAEQRVKSVIPKILSDSDVKAFKEANGVELKALEAAIEEAKANAGDTEVREASIARAHFLARTATVEEAMAAYNEVLGQTVGNGLKMDVVFSMIRLAMLYDDVHLVGEKIEQARVLVEGGGDWERRNLLKVYDAVYRLLVRDVAGAARLFLDSVATFTCTDLMDYQTFLRYTAIACVATVDRVTLKEKVIEAPEFLSAYHELPELQQFLESLYSCKYDSFMASLPPTTRFMQRDRFVAPHYHFITRGIRLAAYKQYLQPYSSVKLEVMASAFGVSREFLTTDVCRFVHSGQLVRKVDLVEGIVYAIRRGTKNGQYQETIKSGDALLQRIQKLTKMI